MITPVTSEEVGLDSLVARVADEFMERQRRGEKPSAEAYASQHPKAAELLKKVLLALEVVDLSAIRTDSKADELQSLQIGTLGDYDILREIGRGGMGVVYQAKQISLGRKVALKVLPFAATLDQRQLQRFHNEARAAACLHHPNIVPVYAVGCERGVHYYAMQFIEGQSLETLIQDLRQEKKPASPSPSPPLEKAPDADATVLQAKANGKVAASQLETKEEIRANASTLQSLGKGRDYFRRIAEIGIQSAEALEHAHQSGVIHRDIKPGNLMLDNHGNLWITDFGLAQVLTDTKLTMTGDLVGTLRYMSPEQALAKRVIVDHRTDLYSLGATLYELLTLKPVFSGNDRQELLRQIAFEEPTALRKVERRIPVELETVILKALEKNPQERYGTAKELAGDLKRFLNDEPTLARRPGMLMRARKWGRRHVAAVRAAAVAMFVIVAVVAGTAGWWLNDLTNREAETERTVVVLLQEADRLQKDQNVPESLARVKQAESVILSGAATPGLKQRVMERLDDLKMAAALEELRGERGGYLGEVDLTDLMRRYVKVFEANGIDVMSLTLTEAAQRIQQKSVSVEVAAALDEWSNVVQRAQANNDAYWKRLLALARAVDPDPARDKFREALERDDLETIKKLAAAIPVTDISVATAVVVGRALYENKAIAEAVQFLRKAQLRFPNDYYINAHLGWCFSHLEPPQYEDAIRFCTAALAVRPFDTQVQCILVDALVKTKRLDEASASIREAIRNKPGVGLFHFKSGNCFAGLGQWESAIAALREAIRLKSETPTAHYNIGIAYGKLGKLDEGIAAYREAIRLKPDYAFAWNNLAGMLCERQQLDEAFAAIKEAIRLKPDNAHAHNNLGNVLDIMQQLDEAIAAYSEAIRLKQDYAIAWNNLGLILAKKQQLDEAIAAFRQAIRVKQDYAEGYGNLGGAFIKKLQLDEANASFLDEAIASFRKAIELNKDHARSHNNLAWLLATCADLSFRDPKEALKLAKRAVELQPKNASYQGTLGVAYYRNDEWKKAIDHLNLATKLRDDLAADFFFLAMSHWRLGDKDQARTSYDRGVQWMDKNRAKNAELLRFRAEAAELLGIEAPKGTDKGG